ncbi:MAG: tRNA 4-thiouridine(8) synthase ThiI [Planctomycetota bacterium]|nr:tRNA 4-thiouridine(8) synthase ThiI [Planctomycetota bacterium]
MSSDRAPDALVVRYGEIALKGGMRAEFERRLCANLRVALQPLPRLEIQRTRGRILVRAGAPLGPAAVAAARVFGVTSVSEVHEVAPEEDAIREQARALTAAALERSHAGRARVSFGVRVNRANPLFPLRSNELASLLGADLQQRHPQLHVNLDAPELNVEVDVRDERALLFVERQPGPGGLPVGTLGRGMCLLSGGIDSPVAAWLAMRRGLRVEFISFLSPPHTGAQTVAKVRRLTEHLATWQPVTWLHMVPMTAVQDALRAATPEPLHTVLDRRAMFRMASRLARRRHARALVTGESLGQVASQTLENIGCTEQAARMPVLRPLITYDKVDTMALARRIGTLPISELPAPDSCTVWLPRSPVLRSRIGEAQAAEEKVPLEDLERQALLEIESLRIPT